MPLLAVPPILVLAALGTFIMARWAAREFRRANDPLDELTRAAQPEEPVDRSRLPTLRPDPSTGEYRLRR